MLNLPHLPYLRGKDPLLAETIESLKKGLISLAEQAGIGASGQIAAPQIQSILVTAANGAFLVTVTDKSATHLGINYFVEYADNANFANVHTLYLGPSRSSPPIFLGSGTFYFRAFPQYQNSPPGAKVVYGGSTPIGVSGGGAIAGPTLPPAQGSGASSGGTAPPSSGFGHGAGARIAFQ